MKLCDAISRYVTYKQGIGMVFETEATILRAFIERVGPNVPVGTINSDSALQYLNGRGPVTPVLAPQTRCVERLFGGLQSSTAGPDRSPLPARRPKEPIPFIPYIYSREELKRLLDGTSTYQYKWRKMEPVTLRAILLLMYGAGLRTGEPLRLTCADVDLTEAILSIRFTKFYKSRRIALNEQLLRVLIEYDKTRRQLGLRRTGSDPFFTYKKW